MNISVSKVCLVVALASLAACSSEEADVSSSVAASDEQPAIDKSRKPVPAPGAPISIRYEVVGTPVVGQSVGVNVSVQASGATGPIDLHYRVMDETSMTFPDTQARIAQIADAREEGRRPQQITVIPQREGRLYLNVSAQVPTVDGMISRTASIPIQVGSAPREMERPGELDETSDGEQIIRMKSEESTQ